MKSEAPQVHIQFPATPPCQHQNIQHDTEYQREPAAARDFQDIGRKQENVDNQETECDHHRSDDIELPVIVHDKKEQNRRNGHGSCHSDPVSAGQIVR